MVKQITKSENGKLVIGDIELFCGNVLEVLVYKHGRPYWIEVTVEHQKEKGYYLKGAEEFFPEGLFGRIY